MFQEKLIIIDSSWLPRKYTARICVLCKYWQQNHLVIPTTQGQENRKRAHGTNAQRVKSTGRKQHKFGDEKESELNETHNRSVSYTDKSKLRWWKDHHWWEMRLECRWTRNEVDRSEGGKQAGARDDRSWLTRDTNNKSQEVAG